VQRTLQIQPLHLWVLISKMGGFGPLMRCSATVSANPRNNNKNPAPAIAAWLENTCLHQNCSPVSRIFRIGVGASWCTRPRLRHRSCTRPQNAIVACRESAGVRELGHTGFADDR